MLRERAVVLGDLIAFRKVGVEVILPGKDRLVIDVQIQRKSSASCHLYNAPVEDGQRSRQTQAHWTRVGVRLVAKPGRAPAKDFRVGPELRVNLETDHDFIFVSHNSVPPASERKYSIRSQPIAKRDQPRSTALCCTVYANMRLWGCDMTTKAGATIEDLYSVPDKAKAEIVNGEIILMSPTGDMPNRVGGSIYISLRQHEGKTPGRAYPEPAVPGWRISVDELFS